MLARLMVEYSASARDDKLGAIGDQLNEIKGVMAKNIELVLERGEKIEILVTKSEQMEEHAFRFNKKATGLKRHFCWKNAKVSEMCTQKLNDGGGRTPCSRTNAVS